MTRIEYADQLIALDANGRITEKGSPAAFGHLGDSLGQPDAKDAKETKRSMTSPNFQQDADPENKEPPKDRQVGDFTVWKYYFQSLGVSSFLLFMSFVAVNSGCQVAECTCPIANNPANVQISGWSCGPTAAIATRAAGRATG